MGNFKEDLDRIRKYSEWIKNLEYKEDPEINQIWKIHQNMILSLLKNQIKQFANNEIIERKRPGKTFDA